MTRERLEEIKKRFGCVNANLPPFNVRELIEFAETEITLRENGLNYNSPADKREQSEIYANALAVHVHYTAQVSEHGYERFAAVMLCNEEATIREGFEWAKSMKADRIEIIQTAIKPTLRKPLQSELDRVQKENSASQKL